MRAAFRRERVLPKCELLELQLLGPELLELQLLRPELLELQLPPPRRLISERVAEQHLLW
jgi:hypothetical protein